MVARATLQEIRRKLLVPSAVVSAAAVLAGCFNGESVEKFTPVLPLAVLSSQASADVFSTSVYGSTNSASNRRPAIVWEMWYDLCVGIIEGIPGFSRHDGYTTMSFGDRFHNLHPGADVKVNPHIVSGYGNG